MAYKETTVLLMQIQAVTKAYKTLLLYDHKNPSREYKF